MKNHAYIVGLIATVAGIGGMFAATHFHRDRHHQHEHHTHIHRHGALEHSHAHSHAANEFSSEQSPADDHHDLATGHNNPIEPWITPSYDVVRRADFFALLPLHYEADTTTSAAFGCVEPPERPPRSITSEDSLPQLRTIVLLT
ncbi:MAG: hypothetical protein AB7N71_07230 [Phycisphaerae bacterium]